jgi:hypothetical protein
MQVAGEILRGKVRSHPAERPSNSSACSSAVSPQINTNESVRATFAAAGRSPTLGRVIRSHSKSAIVPLRFREEDVDLR